MGKAIARRLKQHWTVKHGKMVPKRAFKTLDDALDFLKDSGINMDKYHPYICTDCGQWHIGHSSPKKSKKNDNHRRRS